MAHRTKYKKFSAFSAHSGTPREQSFSARSVAPRYAFRKHGAQGEAYFALVATGANMPYSHYHKGTSKLRDGDLVQFDYAPDFRYYVSDVTRVFPANGKFSARQRELYEIYLRLYQALLTSIRPHTAPRDIIKEAVVKMDSVLARYRFTDTAIRYAATAFVQRYRNSRSNSLGHTIGMEVHDVRLASDVLLPGHIFTIEPAMNLTGERVGLRLEDVILVNRHGLREPLGVRAGGDRGHRAPHGAAGAERRIARSER